MKRTASVLIVRPLGDVFAFLADVGNESQWRSSITESGYTSAGPVAVGTTGFTVVEMGNRHVTMTWTVTRLEPGRHVAWRLSGGPWHGGGAYTLVCRGPATEVEAALEVRLAGAARLLEPLLGFQLDRGLRKDLARLQTLLAGSDVRQP